MRWTFRYSFEETCKECRMKCFFVVRLLLLNNIPSNQFIAQSTKTLLDFEASQQLQGYFGNPAGWDGKMEDWSLSYQREWLTYSR